jgi:TetR/AcrR family transcriptional regulator, mexJK operon transcriptional repressor
MEHSEEGASENRADDTLLVRVSPAGPRDARRGARVDRALDPRTRRTRAAVVEAATSLFLRHGYQGTSTDEIARLAAVSKRTVYNNFGDKERLFTEIILGITVTAEQLADEFASELRHAEDVPSALRDVARRLLEAVTRPLILRLRRLLIAEARRFPDLAREYYRGAPGRTLGALAAAFESLAERGALVVPDPQRAAEHFAFLVLGATLDRAMFDGEQSTPSDAELQRTADDAARAFLAAYGAR